MTIVTDDLPCDCKRCAALAETQTNAQATYVRSPAFVLLPPCPRDTTSPIAVVLQRLADMQLAHTALASRIDRLEEQAARDAKGARFGSSH